MSAPPGTFVIEGFEIVTSAIGDDPRIRDVDLGKRLGYTPPRMVRKLIARLIEAGDLSDVYVRDTVSRTQMPTGGERVTEVTEYRLTQSEAILVCMRSEAPGARKIQKVMVDVLLRVFSAANCRIAATGNGELDKFLLTRVGVTSDWDEMFSKSLVKAICQAYRRDTDWDGGRQPRFVGRVYEWIYRLLMTDLVYEEMKRRVPDPRKGNNLHQQIEAAVRESYLRKQLTVVQTIAEESLDRREFRARLKHRYAHTMLQLALLRSEPTAQIGGAA